MMPAPGVMFPSPFNSVTGESQFGPLEGATPCTHLCLFIEMCLAQWYRMSTITVFKGLDLLGGLEFLFFFPIGLSFCIFFQSLFCFINFLLFPSLCSSFASFKHCSLFLFCFVFKYRLGGLLWIMGSMIGLVGRVSIRYGRVR